ncbi:MAG: hypothetical protein RLZZ453_167 [Chlamydiota bacterium]|jgi:cytidyltransferase-like protein
MKYIFFLMSFCLSLAASPIKRVYVDVVGDLMHMGHISLLKNAREEGDYLIVGVHSDADVAGYKRVPIMTMEERMAVIAACRYVDEVIAYAPLMITEEYIKEHNIDLVIHGDDISESNANKWYGIPMQMGIFKLIPYTKGISTTDLIQRVLDRYKE